MVQPLYIPCTSISSTLTSVQRHHHIMLSRIGACGGTTRSFAWSGFRHRGGHIRGGVRQTTTGEDSERALSATRLRNTEKLFRVVHDPLGGAIVWAAGAALWDSQLRAVMWLCRFMTPQWPSLMSKESIDAFRGTQVRVFVKTLKRTELQD